MTLMVGPIGPIVCTLPSQADGKTTLTYVCRSLLTVQKVACMTINPSWSVCLVCTMWSETLCSHIWVFIFSYNSMVQVNLFQKLATSAEHVVYQNCSECQNKTKTTICVHNMFCRYSELTIFMNNEQSVIILWVSWCKNKSFWQRFTCTTCRGQYWWSMR